MNCPRPLATKRPQRRRVVLVEGEKRHPSIVRNTIKWQAVFRLATGSRFANLLRALEVGRKDHRAAEQQRDGAR
jgi:hypothetical protein